VPTPPTTINIFAVDTDTTGNTATSVNGPDPAHPSSVNPVDQCRAFASNTSQTFDVDIILDQVPSPGMGGFGIDFVYSQSVLNVTAANASMLLNSTAPTGSILPFGVDALPDSDGDFRASYSDFAGAADAGEGVLLRLTLLVVGTGHSALTISTDPAALGNPQVNDQGGGVYVNDHVNNGDIYVGATCPPITPQSLAGPVAVAGARQEPNAVPNAQSDAQPKALPKAGGEPISGSDLFAEILLLVLGGAAVALGGASVVLARRRRTYRAE
jgi:hypothetical protein